MLISISFLLMLAMMFNSLSHPFLLSDNRYTFHLLDRFFVIDQQTLHFLCLEENSLPFLDKVIIFYYFIIYISYRVLLAPVYFTGILLALIRFSESRGPFFLLIFLIASVLSLAPTPLLEPRYFTTALVVAVLNSPKVTYNLYMTFNIIIIMILKLDPAGQNKSANFYVIGTDQYHSKRSCNIYFCISDFSME